MKFRITVNRSKGGSVPAGFTLIELLAVIAIVGVLAGILIAVTGNVRAAAKASACQSNLRQIGAAFHLHAGENRGFLPVPFDPDPTQTWPQNTWMFKLQPYLEGRRVGTTATNIQLCYDGVFRCAGKPDWSLGMGDAYMISYGMNAFDAKNEGTSARAVARRLAALTHPSITMLAMDRATFREDGTVANMPIYILNKNHIYRDAVGLWHGGKDNVLFVDGHVDAVPREGLSYYLLRTENTALRPW